MISKGIYLYTLKRAFKNYVMYIIAFGFIFMLPAISLVDQQQASTFKVDATSSYACALLFGLSLIVSQNLAGSVSSQSGGSDYLPLILSRPISRSKYVFSKWFALVTLILMVSLSQFTVLVIILVTRVPDSQMAVILTCALVERILDAFSVSISLILVSLLPTRQLFGFGVVALELVGLNHIAFDFDFYTPNASSLIPAAWKDIGLIDWLQHNVLTILPTHDISDPFILLASIVTSCADFIAPRFFVFDFLTNASFDLYPLCNYVFNLCVGFMLCLFLINTRDFNYAAE